tara:strand:- start:352 stop:492 length:141 start_codon:yes stop_codon:yes gene_type:complete
MKVGDLVKWKYTGAIGIILVVDTDLIQVANHGWWSKEYAEVISECR